MNQASRRSSYFKNRLFSIVLLPLLFACGRQDDMPSPPKSPPRPVTFTGAIITADFVVPARPAPPVPGQM